jgi:hypothetical protein
MRSNDVPTHLRDRFCAGLQPGNLSLASFF